MEQNKGSINFDSEIHGIFRVDDEEVLTIDMIARLTKMSNETVRRWCKSGKLASYQFGGKYIVVGSDFKEFMRLSRRSVSDAL